MQDSSRHVLAPRVTVLMACYNAAKSLDRAVRSILDQTFGDYEFLIIDDGSSDETLVKLQQYAGCDTRIRLLSNARNMGLAATLNRGIREAFGEYIARMDSDDASRPERLARQVAFMDANPGVGVCGSCYVLHQSKVVSARAQYLEHGEIQAVLLFHSCFAHPTVMFRQSVFRSGLYFYNEEYATTQDYELWTRMVGPVRAANMPEKLLDYYEHKGQNTQSNYHHVTARRNRIREQVVRRLIPSATEEDLSIHNSISFPHEAFDRNKLIAARQWLERLINTNRQSRLYEEDALSRVLAHRWFFVCEQAAFQGLAAYKVFWKSPLSLPLRFTRLSMKLLLKCLMRKKYS